MEGCVKLAKRRIIGMRKAGSWMETGLLGSLDGVCAVAFEDSGECEFAEAMTDHVFRGIDAHEILTVVNEEGVTDEVRSDHGGARPCFDGALVISGVLLVHFVEQCLLDEWAFFE